MPDQAENDAPQDNGQSAGDGNRITLPLPEKLTGSTGPNQTELWSKWHKLFKRYRLASGLNNKDEREQASALLYAMGDCADDILAMMSVDEEKSTFDELVTAFNKYF